MIAALVGGAMAHFAGAYNALLELKHQEGSAARKMSADRHTVRRTDCNAGCPHFSSVIEFQSLGPVIPQALAFGLLVG
jgi:hypothetical protein